jgi:hypothetical protein
VEAIVIASMLGEVSLSLLSEFFCNPLQRAAIVGGFAALTYGFRQAFQDPNVIAGIHRCSNSSVL